MCLVFLNREGMDANQMLRSRFSSAVSSVLEDANTASKKFISSIDRKYLVLFIRGTK